MKAIIAGIVGFLVSWLVTMALAKLFSLNSPEIAATGVLLGVSITGIAIAIFAEK